jgi:tetratricopeptide (TPR) repeat protein
MLIVPVSIIAAERPIEKVLSSVASLPRGHTAISRTDYLLTQFPVITTYLRLVFLPINQNIDYDYPIYHSALDLRVFFSFLLLCTLLSAAIYFYYRSRLSSSSLRLLSFGILWWFIALSVESSIIPISMVIDEYRVYLPSAGGFIALTSATFFVLVRIRGRARKTLIAILVLVPVVFSVATYKRNSVWASEISLWKDVVSKSPQKAGGHNNLGMAYRTKNILDDAIREFQIALQLNPNLFQTHSNIASAYMAKGMSDKALRHFQTSLELMPYNAEAHFNIGLIYLAKGFVDKARKAFQMALQVKPNYYQAKQFLNYINTTQTKE